MIRASKGLLGKSTKIAFSILGTPSNLRDKNAFSSKAQEHLSYEETRRVK